MENSKAINNSLGSSTTSYTSASYDEKNGSIVIPFKFTDLINLNKESAVELSAGGHTYSITIAKTK